MAELIESITNIVYVIAIIICECLVLDFFTVHICLLDTQ